MVQQLLFTIMINNGMLLRLLGQMGQANIALLRKLKSQHFRNNFGEFFTQININFLQNKIKIKHSFLRCYQLGI